MTLWQRAESRRIEQGANGNWSISIPASNTLDAAHEPFILKGIAADPGSVRRYRLALDLPLIRRVSEEEYTFLRVEEWVNKSLNFRSTDIVFADDPDAQAGVTADTWLPVANIDGFMGRMFPWLTYRYVRYDDDGGAGEIAVHTLEVELSEIGKAALLLDEFHENGPIEPDVPTTPPVSQRWIDGIDDNGDLG